ncbi:putative D-lactate dehydrogenase, mitochondrial [Fragariocoptes setiger]|uniref:D-lactate dehydrogenase (cytochrome) n=1 Tax=Fragariocoptes setiger TaxID=1670756 RepID=A0ABQ7SDE1_9ACAR|nr:putative D-lactate dehydrogenase, mitochondrial [Fragariocoptes setiger]
MMNKRCCWVLFRQAERWMSRSSWTSHHKTLNQAYDDLAEILLRDSSTKSAISRSESVLSNIALDESCYEPKLPHICVIPSTTIHVSECVAYCYKNNIPMVAVGARTGLEGGIHAMHGGVSFDLTSMNNILELNERDLDCNVQTGLSWRELNNQIRSTGLWFPVDPGASASLGGMAATSASGTNAVKYGTMRENVMGLEVVVADGKVIRTAGEKCRSKKSSAGLNITNLYVGSEGILGIITSIRLKLHTLPSCIGVVTVSFPNVKSAIQSVVEIMQSGMQAARVEFLDRQAVTACRKASQLSTLDDRGPMLFIEMHGFTESALKDQVDVLSELVKDNGATNLEWSSMPEKRTELWKARHDLHWSILATKPGFKAIDTDVCVPLSNLCDMILCTHQLIKESGLSSSIMSHAGDGNFHAVILHDPNDNTQLIRAKKLAENIANVAIDFDGTVTGEHGVGRGKVSLIERQFNKQSLDVMYLLKRSLDPKNLFNPDKMFSAYRIFPHKTD